MQQYRIMEGDVQVFISSLGGYLSVYFHFGGHLSIYPNKIFRASSEDDNRGLTLIKAPCLFHHVSS